MVNHYDRDVLRHGRTVNQKNGIPYTMVY